LVEEVAKERPLGKELEGLVEEVVEEEVELLMLDMEQEVVGEVKLQLDKEQGVEEPPIQVSSHY
jgi:hypothetical protein